MFDTNLIYYLALTCTPGIGCITAKKLLDALGSAEAVFTASTKELKTIFGKREQTIKAIENRSMFSKCEKELAFVEKHNLRLLCYDDILYPYRLKNVSDAPPVLYEKGNVNLNAPKIIGIVGTRNATHYGRHIVDEIVSVLSEDGAVVVSGLAYGIDGEAHRAALRHGLSTVGVLGHGLDILYPSEHRSLADDMMAQNGGMVTEFMSGTALARENFPQRNRIIAGLCDALVVIEASEKGGALITANLAFDYNREVFAIPGRWGDPFSVGVNHLIKTNRAQLITKPEDIRYFLNWRNERREKKSPTLFLDLSTEEQRIYDTLAASDGKSVDEIRMETNYTPSQIATILLSMEMDGIITCQPGKVYKVNR